MSAESMKWVPSAPSTGKRGAGAGGAGRHRRAASRAAAGGRAVAASTGERCLSGAHGIRNRAAHRRPPSCAVRHQRQQEAGRDHEAKQRHHQREDLRRGREAFDAVCDPAAGGTRCMP